MRAVYKNPRELATCLKDIVDNYYEDLITYDTMSDKIMKIVNANKDAVYKEKAMSVKIANILGEERVNIIDEVVNSNK
ncbi:TIGR04540 family protein [Clostridium sp. SM-530-WT-3G]|uniref:TIGR04540 family protein n=1 Tax=Clostridium sp. SM-530-WT-3G TaxID=2725303 RepID=UPI000EED1039|nr:TIGR04540 family protein [Clostridium sp. SM-530-WT-3G]NME83568.1 TIGR04540 family protein [Clostridium sp. SM-530-WT-3G]HCW52804.1 ribonuclease P [Clostridium sp.]